MIQEGNDTDAAPGSTPGGAGRVIGLGGLFLLSEDPAGLAAWYQTVLGMEPSDFGGFHFLHGDSSARFADGARTVFSAFAADSDYLSPSRLSYMFNLMVDDLAAILERAAAAGVEPVQPLQQTDYGSFAWVMDPEGRKVELWEPPRTRAPMA
jgi:predicted enzyme related to lactoylglutathione lyase